MAIAICVEVGELLEHFLWRADAELDEHLQEAHDDIEQEVADVAIFLVFFCDAMGIDLLDAIDRKQRLNIERHPVERSRGRSRVSPDD